MNLKTMEKYQKIGEQGDLQLYLVDIITNNIN